MVSANTLCKKLLNVKCTVVTGHTNKKGEFIKRSVISEFNFSSTRLPKFNQNDSKPPTPISKESSFNAVYRPSSTPTNQSRQNPTPPPDPFSNHRTYNRTSRHAHRPAIPARRESSFPADAPLPLPPVLLFLSY